MVGFSAPPFPLVRVPDDTEPPGPPALGPRARSEYRQAGPLGGPEEGREMAAYPNEEPKLREQAIARLKQKAGFARDVVAYVLVNGLVVGI